MLAELGEGVDPRKAEAGRRDDAKRKQAQAEAGAFLQLAKAYVEHKADKIRPKTLYETKRYLIGLDNAAPAVWQPLHTMTLSEITRRVIKDQLEEISNESGTITADRARAALSGFYAWAIKRDKVDANPVLGIGAATESENTKRDRALSDAELRAICKRYLPVTTATSCGC